MNRISIFLLLSITSLFGINVPTEHSKLHSFGKSIELNSKIIQLSNAKQSVTSLVNGHLEKYFVEAGQNVKAGQKIALIESILVSKMTADYISYKKQFTSLEENYSANKKLYEKGMLSLQKLNTLSNELNSMRANASALESQLGTLGIDTNNIKEATGNFILYAHSAGRVSSLLQPLHTVIREDEALITIIKNQAFYVKSYLPLEYSNVVKVGQKLSVNYNGRKIVTHVAQILPELDVKTQRIIVLSSIDEKADDLFINTFVSSTLYFEPTKKQVAVKKSALSFFNNEWVVFIHKLDHDEEKHDEHDEEEHDENEEETVPYEARVVEIINHDDDYVGVQGLEVGEEYVSDKSYYVKSMMLKSSLGEHGH
ncbi:efflux RND transporter periplasmic adaptor subunit [Sulfurimonas sp.]|nr:efflux RND transporter periplasmic adaptor subunit [Sulfurimonas sp.]